MADNRRVRMTKKLIKDAYLELLESNPSEKSLSRMYARSRMSTAQLSICTMRTP